MKARILTEEEKIKVIKFLDETIPKDCHTILIIARENEEGIWCDCHRTTDKVQTLKIMSTYLDKLMNDTDPHLYITEIKRK